MMINKRLIAMMGDSKRYIARNVALQWVALLANIAMIFAVSAFLAGLVYGQGSLSAALLVLLGALLILLAVSLMQEKGVSVLEAVKRQQLWFRWLIYLAAIFVVLLTGIYGPGFAASSFIYFQF